MIPAGRLPPRVSSTVAAVWVHVSCAHIPDGALVRSPKSRDVKPRYVDADRAEKELGQYRRDMVSVFDPDTTSVEHFRGNFAWFNDANYAYEVELIGEREDDPERGALPSFQLCKAARVVRCLCTPVVR